jgi:hypothetical protein
MKDWQERLFYILMLIFVIAACIVFLFMWFQMSISVYKALTFKDAGARETVPPAVAMVAPVTPASI